MICKRTLLYRALVFIEFDPGKVILKLKQGKNLIFLIQELIKLPVKLFTMMRAFCAGFDIVLDVVL